MYSRKILLIHFNLVIERLLMINSIDINPDCFMMEGGAGIVEVILDGKYNNGDAMKEIRKRLYLLLVCCCLIGAGSSTMVPAHPVDGQQQDAKVILFFGNSLTAGYGIDPDLAFPALIQKKIDALGWNFTVINGGLSGETTAGGLRRIDWVLQRKIDVLFLELGANDGLRGVALNNIRQNLQAIINKTRTKYPDVKIVLAGVRIPPNLGPEYTTRFGEIFPSLASGNKILLIPRLLEGVGGIKELNLPDGIHPKPEGHAIVVETVWKMLKPILESLK